MIKKYIPSGEASFVGVLKALLFGVLSAFILPLIYIIINRLIPNIWFAAISAVLLGMGMGIAINRGIKLGKIRNMKIAVAVAVFCGLLAYYMQWVIFDELMYSNAFTFNLNLNEIGVLLKNFFYLFSHPSELWAEITALNEVGSFSIKGSDVINGSLLWVVWFGEFAIIMSSVLYFVITGTVSEPFSEKNDSWMKKRTSSLIIPFIHDKEELIRDFNNNEFKALNPSELVPDDNYYAEVVIHESSNDSTRFVTIKNISVEKKKKNKEEVKKELVVKYYPIDKTIYDV